MKCNYSEECPYCGRGINDLYGAFQAHDYDTNFDLECVVCKRVFEVQVHSVPEFECIEKRAAAKSGIATEQPITPAGVN